MPRPFQIVLLSLAGPVGFLAYNAIAEQLSKAINAAWNSGESPLAHMMGSALVCGLLHAALFVVCLCRGTTRVGRDILISFAAFTLSLGLVPVGWTLGVLLGLLHK